MTLELESANYQFSPLAGFDPRWKLLGFSLAIFLTALINSPFAATFAFLLYLVLLFQVCPFPSWRNPKLAWVALGLLLFSLPAPLLATGQPLKSFSGLAITREGISLGAMLFFKGLAIACLGLCLVGSQSHHDLIRGLQGLGVPAKIASVFWLFIRYLDLILEEFKRMRVALAGKGYRPKNFLQHAWQLSRLSGNLLIRAMDHSNHVSMAVLARGFQGSFHSLDGFQSSRKDGLLFIFLLLTGLGILALDRGVFLP
ncbi:MAG: energy-coupling factor transporter transmembrane protein EcfT [Gemmataceae bacterium]|nr:energy-coupling factor transporter transmembrane protein EcfT [Gemmataceae bacterium]